MNKVNLKLMSKTTINITDKQLGFLFDKFQKITYLESKLENSGLELSPNILSTSLLEREGMDSSIIEGTQTNHDEMYFDITDGIRDKYSWEVRNLINLYKSSFRDIKDGIIDYTVDHIKILHTNLFKRNIEGFKNNFDPIEIIKMVKPGTILSDDSKPNWIGPIGRSIEDASLVLVEPSKKTFFLEDALKEIRKNKGKRNIKTLIKFHPFFEAIHPFSDGNGRLGRLLLVNLFSYLGFSKYNWIFISDYWRKNRDEYISQIKHVQLTDEWDEWVSFFVNSLNETVDLTYKKLNNVLELYKDVVRGKDLNAIEKKILQTFFKYPILNKTRTIKTLVNKGYPQAGVYRAFDKIVILIEAIKDKNYKFINLLNIISE